MLKPLADHIVVEITTKEEKTASGIYLPDTASNFLCKTSAKLFCKTGRQMTSFFHSLPRASL